MYKYKILENEIVAMQQIENEEILQSYAKGLLPYEEIEWQETEKPIACIGGKLLFVDSSEFQQAQAEQEQAIAKAEEEQALKPTVEDLAEALDILTNIVLGGE